MPTVIFRPSGSQVVKYKGLERVADVDPRLTRSHYFDNRLLTAEDLNRDQIYLDGRLREVGRALGNGVISGLELELDTLSGELHVSPGIALSEAGRVLELGRSLVLDLNDRAAISELNEGRNRRFNRALYAVVLRYAEVGTDIAEVFPTDLGEKRDFDFDVISEGVQLALVPLNQALPQQSPIQIRAQLIQKLYRDNHTAALISDDAVALGIVAIANDRPQWLDSSLLRRPLRDPDDNSLAQHDLYRQYQKLFSDLMDERRAGSLTGDFAASDYFRFIPPAGSLPKESIDPVTGRQGFFPENYNVWIAPIRKAELDLIIQESLELPPLELALEEPMNVMVLAPLAHADYATHATRLERQPDLINGKPGGLDLLRLRLFPRNRVHELDTDRTTWQAIWDSVDENELMFIRRPLRAAETQMSGILLNTGATPAPSDPFMPTPSDSNLLADEADVFLNRLNLAHLAELRGGSSTEATTAATTIQIEFANDLNVVQHALNIALRVERQYDDALWQTLLSLARSEQLAEFLAQLQSAQDEDQITGNIVANIGASFSLDASLLNLWSSLTTSP